MNLLTKGVLSAIILLAAGTVIQDQTVNAKEKGYAHGMSQKSDDLDVSKGWKILNFSSSTISDVNSVFLQGVETSGNQICALVQAGNVGDASLTAQKVIPMKKGHKYDLDLIYAQFYDQKGSGYIDFNGKKIPATNESGDQHYKESITPTEDMDYTITVSFTTAYPGNAYFKLGYDKGTGGIIDTPTELAAPVVSPDPEAGTNQVFGTADKGNKVIVSDSKGEIGNGTVSSDGKFEIDTNRPLHFGEMLSVVQKDNTDHTSPVTQVKVIDTQAPQAPTLKKITDEDKEVSGSAEPYSTVHVTFDDPKKATYSGETDEEGNFNISLEHTYPGKTKLTAIAIAESKLESQEAHAEVQYSHDLSVNLLRNISSNDEIIQGKTSRVNCEVIIHFGNRIFTGKSDTKGDFEIPIEKYAPGTDFIVEATDPISQEKATISGKILPRIPSLSTASAGYKVLEGVVDPGAEVTLELKRGETIYKFNTTADSTGKFSIALKDNENKDITLALKDQLTYSAHIGELASDEGTVTILTF